MSECTEEKSHETYVVLGKYLFDKCPHCNTLNERINWDYDPYCRSCGKRFK
jgi:hypothetical protein